MSHGASIEGNFGLTVEIKEVLTERKTLNSALKEQEELLEEAMRIICWARRTTCEKKDLIGPGSTKYVIGLVALKLCSRTSKGFHFCGKVYQGIQNHVPAITLSFAQEGI